MGSRQKQQKQKQEKNIELIFLIHSPFEILSLSGYNPPFYFSKRLVKERNEMSTFLCVLHVEEDSVCFGKEKKQQNNKIVSELCEKEVDANRSKYQASLS